MINVDINAETLLKLRGNRVIGMHVDTECIGDWPGGPCKIVSLCDDDDDIVFFVEHEEPLLRIEDKVMGIFWDETVTVLPPPEKCSK